MRKDDEENLETLESEPLNTHTKLSLSEVLYLSLVERGRKRESSSVKATLRTRIARHKTT